MPANENELGQEKTEQPTSRRRQKAREKGSVARSKEINSAVMLFFGVCTFALYGPYVMRQLLESIIYYFTHFHEIDLTNSTFRAFANEQVFFLLRLLLPAFALFILIGVIVNIAQFGWLFTNQTIFQGLKNFSLNPTKFIKKILGAGTWVKLGIDIAKLAVLGIVAYVTLKGEVEKFPSLVTIPLSESLRYIAWLIFELAMKIVVLLLIIAIIDFVYQKYKHEKTLKMSKQEVKEEMKQVEGDPKIKAQIRSAQMKMMVGAMVKNVPDADVVITNPYHIAVAIKYDSETMVAPTLIAKGARLIAERIKEAARNAAIPIIENKPLAQTIYKTIDVGQEIPPKLYQAVAEILAYVYKLNREHARDFARV